MFECTLSCRDLIEQNAIHPNQHDIAPSSSSTTKETGEDVNSDDELLLPTGTPLLFLYGCQSTGTSIYDDRIVEIAAEVIKPEKVVITTKFFSELCHTSRQVSSKGMHNQSIKVPYSQFLLC